MCKFWELDNDEPQVVDVQGRLKQDILFWKEVLRAPPPIVEYIENGYRLPLKFIPPPHFQAIIKLQSCMLNLLIIQSTAY